MNLHSQQFFASSPPWPCWQQQSCFQWLWFFCTPHTPPWLEFDPSDWKAAWLRSIFAGRGVKWQSNAPFLWEHVQSLTRRTWLDKKLITTVVVLTISVWGFRFCRASSHKESLAMLNWLCGTALRCWKWAKQTNKQTKNAQLSLDLDWNNA